MTVREGEMKSVEEVHEAITAVDVCVAGGHGTTAASTSSAEGEAKAASPIDKDKPPAKIVLSTDVDTAVLASKYMLTGGFIKNAVLSAILMALSR